MTISLSRSGVANTDKQSDFYRKLESLKLLTEVNTIMDRIDRIDPMEVKAIMDRTLEPTEVNKAVADFVNSPDGQDWSNEITL